MYRIATFLCVVVVGVAAWPVSGPVQITPPLMIQTSTDELIRARLRLAPLVADFSAERAALAALLGEEWYL